LNNRLIQVCDRLLSPNQTTFIKGRYILESVVPDHEVIHEIAMEKDSSVILKLDYEKAYDRINWNFLEEFLISSGFRTSGLPRLDVSLGVLLFVCF
jgi:hypothetical protein